MSYHRGKVITCPSCGREAIVTLVSDLDGWTKVGEHYACGLCGVRLAEVKGARAEPAPEPACTERLSSFLGTKAEAKHEVIADDGERRFCRDCRHFFDHPFQTRCLLHKREVNPMDDCADFERRQDV